MFFMFSNFLFLSPFHCMLFFLRVCCFHFSNFPFLSIFFTVDCLTGTCVLIVMFVEVSGDGGGTGCGGCCDGCGVVN